MEKLYIKRVWKDKERIYAETTNGMIASYAFADWNRLAGASDEERGNFKLSYSGIHWPQIDEDLSFDGMFKDNNIAQYNPSRHSVVYDL